MTIPAKLGGKAVAVIGSNALSGFSGVTSLTIPSSVTTIEEYAFHGCSGLTSVKIPDSVTYIGEEAFCDCELLQCVEFGKKVSFIAKEAFADCNYLRSLVFRGNAPTVGDGAFSDVAPECAVYVAKSAKGWGAVFGIMDVIVGDCMAPVAVRYYYDEMAKYGTVSGGGEFAVGKKVTLKATPNKNCVFGGWYDCSGMGEQFLGYSQSLSYTVTGADASICARFYPAGEDADLYVASSDYETEDGGYVWIKTTGEYLFVDTKSEPKLTFKGLPSGVKYDAKKFAVEGTATTPGIYKVQVSATNKSVKKATEESSTEFEICVPNFMDDAIKVNDIYPDAKGFVPGEFTYVQIDGAEGCKVTGLPSGMKWTAKATTATKPSKETVDVPANTVYGVPTKPGNYTVFFTKTTADKVKHTATATFKVGPFPKLTIKEEGNGSGSVSGGGEYAASANVKLTAKADAGSVFTGWFDDEDELLSQASSYTYPMAVADITIVAKFATLEEDRANIKTKIGAMFEAEGEIGVVDPGATVDVSAMCGVFHAWWIDVDAWSQTTVKVSTLPSGLKFTTKEIPWIDGVLPANTIYGVPAKSGDYNVKITVTTAGKTSVSYTLAIHVSNLADWATGQFNGFILPGDEDDDDDGIPDIAGLASFTVASNGKISGKINTIEGKTWTFSASNFDGMLSHDGTTAIVAFITCKSGGKKAGMQLMLYNSVELENPMGTTMVVMRGGLGEGQLFKSCWNDEQWKSIGQKINKKTLTMSSEDEEEGIKETIDMTFSSDGSVKVARDYNGYKATCSTTLIPMSMPNEEEAGSFKAMIIVCFPGNEKVGAYPILTKLGVMWNGIKGEFESYFPEEED